MKYLSRATEIFYCMDHLADYLGTTAEDLAHMITVFQRQGCMLFPPLEKTPETEGTK